MNDLHDRRELLTLRQSYSLDDKIRLTELRIREWYTRLDGSAYVSFSGGKDSTVLLNIARLLYPDIEAVFVDTGLQYPEVKKFALSYQNVTKLRPKMSYRDVIKKYGWPVTTKSAAHMLEDLQNPTEHNIATCHLYNTGYTIDGRDRRKHFRLAKKWRYLIDAPFKVSDRCCDVMKKRPVLSYQKTTKTYPMLATMTADSSMRERQYLRLGCNAFDTKNPRSMPMAFWNDQDVLRYVLEFELPIASVYGDVVSENNKLKCSGERSTGCIFCGFGVQYDGDPNRFQRLKRSHPKLWAHCMNKLGMKDVLEFMSVPIE